MLSSTSGSRLAMVAGQRRRDRRRQQQLEKQKQQQQRQVANDDNKNQNSSSTDGAEEKNKENKGKASLCRESPRKASHRQRRARGQNAAACSPYNATFDDSTISTKPSYFASFDNADAIDGNGTVQEEQEVGEDGPYEVYDFTLPRIVLSPRHGDENGNDDNGKSTTLTAKHRKNLSGDVKNSSPSSAPAVNDDDNDKPMTIVTTTAVTTPRRGRNISSSYHAKLRGGGASTSYYSSSSSAASTTASTTSASRSTNRERQDFYDGVSAPPPPPPPYPPKSSRGSSLSSRKIVARNRLRGATGRSASPSPRTKAISEHGSNNSSSSNSNNNNSSNSNTNQDNDDHSATSADAGPAIHDPSSSIVERESPSSPALSAFRSQIRGLAAERDGLKSDVASYRRKLRDAMEAKAACAHDAKDRVHTLAAELSRAQSEARRARGLEEELEDVGRESEARMKEKEEFWKRELEEVRTERDALEDDWKAELEDKGRETEARLKEKDELWKRELEEVQTERDAMEENWKMCLEELDRMEEECEGKYARSDQTAGGFETEKNDMLADFKGKLTAAERKLSELQSEKLDVEQRLQDQISDLTNELQLKRNSMENVKGHHSKVVEGLKSDLARARQLREEGAWSLQLDMRQMKEEHDESIKYYKSEAEGLRAQLRGIKTRADADRKERTDEIRRLRAEKESLETESSQARGSVARLKVREKDIEMLESELDKTSRAKLEADAELKDAKLQLQAALRNLDEMAEDGAKMRCDLEGAMENFTKEKDFHQTRISHLKSCNDKQKRELDDLSREKDRHEENCNELRMSVQELKDRLAMETSCAEKQTRELEYSSRAMENLTKEKELYQIEISQLKSCNERQKQELDDLSSEKDRHEENCNEMRRSVQEMKDRLRKATSFTEKQTHELKYSSMENSRYEGSCHELKGSLKELEQELAREVEQRDTDDNNRKDLESEIRRLKKRLKMTEDELASAMSSSVAAAAMASQRQASESEQHRLRTKQLQDEKVRLQMQIERDAKSLEALRAAQDVTSAELSRATQTNQILKSKERYLESRVESLANQISKTVQDYEMRMSLSKSLSLSSSESGSPVSGNLNWSESDESDDTKGDCGSGLNQNTQRTTRQIIKEVGDSGNPRVGSTILKPRARVGGGSSRFGDPR